MSLREDYIAAVSSMKEVTEDFIEFEDHVRSNSMDSEPLAHGPVADDGSRSGCILSVAEIEEVLGGREDSMAKHVRGWHGEAAVIWWRMRIRGGRCNDQD